MLVLVGNNPRFPWEPPTTMLTYRLKGTTEASVSDRNEHHHHGRPMTSPAQDNNRGEPPTSSLAPASTQRCSTLLTSSFFRRAERIRTSDLLTPSQAR